MPRAAIGSIAIMFTVAFGYGSTAIVRSNFAAEEAQPTLRAGPSEGTEIAVLMFVSTTCAVSRNPDFPDEWRALVDGIAGSVGDQFTRVATIGVVDARSVPEGVEFLNEFGGFDEISVGRANAGMMRYFVADHPGTLATPQVVVVRRHFERGPDGALIITSEEVMSRLVGLGAISNAGRRLDLATAL